VLLRPQLDPLVTGAGAGALCVGVAGGLIELPVPDVPVT
jgi:hypothetical protein